jgi:hypothetical protein
MVEEYDGRRKYALVILSSGRVWNTCRWNGVTAWNHLPNGIKEFECPEEVGPGWFKTETGWEPPPPPEPDPPPEG